MLQQQFRISISTIITMDSSSRKQPRHLKRKWLRTTSTSTTCSRGDIDVPLFQRKDFALGACLGKGGFSKVYSITRTRRRANILQQDTSSASSTPFTNFPALSFLRPRKEKKKFAMKLLRESTLKKKASRARSAAKDMINEAKLLSIFHHENIISLHGFGEFPPLNIFGSPQCFKEIFLVLDELDYTLKEKMSKWEHCHRVSGDSKGTMIVAPESLNLDEELGLKVDIALQIGDALEYIHQHEHILRDLKPENIGFITKKRLDEDTGKFIPYLQVKLFDFGLCRKLPKPVIEHSIEKFYKMSFVGTPSYMAPEVQKRKLYNTKADVYSWSLIFYRMLTLRKPDSLFSDDKQRALDLLDGDRPTFDYSCLPVPSELQSIICDAWRHKVSERCSMSKVITELRCYHNNLKCTPKYDYSQHILEEELSTYLYGNSKAQLLLQ